VELIPLDLQYNFALAYAYKLILKSDIAADVQMELITSKKKKKSKVLFKLVHKEMSKTQRMGHIFKFVGGAPPPPPPPPRGQGPAPGKLVVIRGWKKINK
jgi:hypothetical protein